MSASKKRDTLQGKEGYPPGFAYSQVETWAAHTAIAIETHRSEDDGASWALTQAIRQCFFTTKLQCYLLDVARSITESLSEWSDDDPYIKHITQDDDDPDNNL